MTEGQKTLKMVIMVVGAIVGGCLGFFFAEPDKTVLCIPIGVFAGVYVTDWVFKVAQD